MGTPQILTTWQHAYTYSFSRLVLKSLGRRDKPTVEFRTIPKKAYGGNESPLDSSLTIEVNGILTTV